MKKFFTLLAISLFLNVFSQNDIEIFGPTDLYYEGNYKKLFTEMLEIVKKENLQPCSSSEIYSPSILIEKDSSIKLVKDFDSLTIANNKCAFDFSNKILPYLKHWKPLQIKGKTYSAIAKFQVKPFYVYHSKSNPDLNKSTNPIFSKGINQFRLDVGDIFSKDLIKNKDAYYTLTFIIDENGLMKNIDVTVYPEDEIKNKNNLISQVSRIRGKWTSGTFNNIPSENFMRLPLKQEFDMSWEKQIQDDKFKDFQSK